MIQVERGPKQPEGDVNQSQRPFSNRINRLFNNGAFIERAGRPIAQPTSNAEEVAAQARVAREQAEVTKRWFDGYR